MYNNINMINGIITEMLHQWGKYLFTNKSNHRMNIDEEYVDVLSKMYGLLYFLCGGYYGHNFMMHGGKDALNLKSPYDGVSTNPLLESFFIKKSLYDDQNLKFFVHKYNKSKQYILNDQFSRNNYYNLFDFVNNDEIKFFFIQKLYYVQGMKSFKWNFDDQH